MADITMDVTLTGITAHRWRIWCGVKLMHLAAWVMGTGLHVEMRRHAFKRQDRRQAP